MNDLGRLNELRRRVDDHAQAEAPLYGLGPLTFLDEIATDDLPGLPGFFSLLRRYKGAIVDRPKYMKRAVRLLESEDLDAMQSMLTEESWTQG